MTYRLTADGQPVLVEVRCKVCGRLCNEVVTAPTSEKGWAHGWQFDLCSRHGEGAGSGNIVAWQERQRRMGKPSDEVRVREWRPWSDLRSAVEKARRTGKTTVAPL
jgi:hypothetical protein